MGDTHSADFPRLDRSWSQWFQLNIVELRPAIAHSPTRRFALALPSVKLFI
jgi:hypothetical protein